MNSLALDLNNDLFIESGSFKRVADGAQVAQKVKSRLQLILGENENYPDEGVPYFTDIFVKPVDLAQVEATFKSIILLTEGVDTLSLFNFDLNTKTRKYTLNFAVNTVWGEINITEFTINEDKSVGSDPIVYPEYTTTTEDFLIMTVDTSEALIV